MKIKKGQRYSVQNVEKRKKPKREVLSYEDVPLDEPSSDNVEISKTAVKRIIIVVVIMLVLGLVVFAIANRDNLTPEKISNWVKYDLLGSSDTGYPVKIIGTNVNDNNFVCDSGVAYVSDTAYVSLSSEGNELCYNRHSFSKPIINTDGELQAIRFMPKGTETRYYMEEKYYPHAILDTVAHMFPDYKITDLYIRNLKNKMTYQCRIARVKCRLFCKKEVDPKVISFETNSKIIEIIDEQ